MLELLAQVHGDHSRSLLVNILDLGPHFEDGWFVFDNVEDVVGERCSEVLLDLVFFIIPSLGGSDAVDIADCNVGWCDCRRSEV